MNDQARLRRIMIQRLQALTDGVLRDRLTLLFFELSCLKNPRTGGSLEQRSKPLRRSVALRDHRSSRRSAKPAADGQLRRGHRVARWLGSLPPRPGALEIPAPSPAPSPTLPHRPAPFRRIRPSCGFTARGPEAILQVISWWAVLGLNQ